MRPFTKLVPALWTNPIFKDTPDKPRLLWLYYLGGPHQNMHGVARIPDSFAASDLGWTIKATKDARAILESKGIIIFDAATDEVALRDWWQHNGPDSPDHYKGALRALATVQSPEIRKMMEESLTEFWNRKQCNLAKDAIPALSRRQTSSPASTTINPRLR